MHTFRRKDQNIGWDQSFIGGCCALPLCSSAYGLPADLSKIMAIGGRSSFSRSWALSSIQRSLLSENIFPELGESKKMSCAHHASTMQPMKLSAQP
jgi:hypothetical protein